jgi:tight adherence protein B
MNPQAKEFLLVAGASVLTALAVLVAYRPFLRLWDEFAATQIHDLSARFRALRIDDRRLPLFMRLWGISLLALLLIVGVGLRMYPIAVALVVLSFLAPRIILGLMVERRSYLLRNQLAPAGLGLANACRSGLSLAQAFEAVQANLPEPIAAEFRQIVGEYQAGRPLPAAMSAAKERLGLEGFSLLVSALEVCLERGGKLTEALDRICYSLQENQRLERKIEADTQSGRMVVIVLCSFPFLFLLGYAAIDPTGVSLLFSSLVGQLIFTALIVIVFIAARWAKQIMDIDV